MSTLEKKVDTYEKPQLNLFAAAPDKKRTPRKAQWEIILEHMRVVGPIDVLTAFKLYNITSLPNLVNVIKHKKGINVIRVKRLSRDGKKRVHYATRSL